MLGCYVVITISKSTIRDYRTLGQTIMIYRRHICVWYYLETQQ